MKAAFLKQVLADRAAKLPVAVVTDLADGRQAIVHDDGAPTGDIALNDEQITEVRKALRADESGTLDSADGKLFAQVHNPPPRLLLVGAVHISQALAPMAAMTGYGVSVIDPRRAFATDERFPGVAMRGDWPDEAMADLKPDRRTAVVTLTHDPKLDDPALQAALRSPAFYIGALGSRKTHAARLERLAAAGFTPEQTARVHGPVGLSIGALSPAEIAISVLAQITTVRRGG
ncbi:MAG TPA: XdhC family protein [Dongiaceae bacterium]